MSSDSATDPAELLACLCTRTERRSCPRAAFVMAHPDDETVSASFMLSRVASPLMIYVTDGAPRDGQDARAAGYATWTGYARARKQELRSALQTAGAGDARLHFLDIPDQQASEDLAFVAREITELFRHEHPEFVVTHTYEGGHPDHDACAFAVRAALALLEQEHTPVPVLIEMTSYHLKGGGFAFGSFLENSDLPCQTVRLDEEARQLKQRLLGCFPTQQRTLRSVPVDTERYRLAPRYDFTRAPHPGQLLYEMFSWKMTGARWRRLAQGAMEELGLTHTLASEGSGPLLSAVPARG